MTRALAALILLLSASVATATVDGWPALFDVTDVAADDVLNVRRAPDASSEIIGTLAPNATSVEVIEPNDDHTWGRVATGEGMGWVSLAYLARQPGQWDGQFPAFTQCSGTEPFWSLSRTDDEVTFDGLDLPSVTAPVDFRESSLNHRGRHSFRAGEMVGLLSNRICNDGMSEFEYGWEINLILLHDGPQTRHYVGCCSIRPRAE